MEKEIEKVDVEKVIEIQTTIEKDPEVQEIIVEKAVTSIEQQPVEVYIDRLVDRVIYVKDIVPVEQRVEVPI